MAEKRRCAIPSVEASVAEVGSGAPEGGRTETKTTITTGIIGTETETETETEIGTLIGIESGVDKMMVTVTEGGILKAATMAITMTTTARPITTTTRTTMPIEGEILSPTEEV